MHRFTLRGFIISIIISGVYYAFVEKKINLFTCIVFTIAMLVVISRMQNAYLYAGLLVLSGILGSIILKMLKIK